MCSLEKKCAAGACATPTAQIGSTRRDGGHDEVDGGDRPIDAAPRLNEPRSVDGETVRELDDGDCSGKAVLVPEHVLEGANAVDSDGPVPTDGRKLFPMAFDDGVNDRPVGELCLEHERLLRAGWRPVRWRREDGSDLELVVSDGFWIERTPRGNPAIWPTFERFNAARLDGRSSLVRDAEGNLILVAPNEAAKTGK